MKALLDTGVWFRRYHRLPLSKPLQKFLAEEVTEFHLSPLSVAEITYTWKRGKLPYVPDPQQWVSHSLENFLLESVSPEIALRSGLWDWDDGDLVDRTLSAIAVERDLTLIHTDKLLRTYSGFPQKWFQSTEIAPA